MKDERRQNEQTDLFELLPQAITRFKKNVIDPFFTSSGNGDDDKRLPLRSEIFTEEQSEQHAKALAARHTLITGQPSERLLKRLAENEEILLEVHSNLTEILKRNKRIAPAAEWLLDNFYLIEEQIYTAKRHLPKGYSKGLPQLAKGVSAGLPRIYDIAVEIISHSDGHVNLKSLNSFVNAYQTVNTLKLGELWAIPIMLRLALLENIRRLSIQISIDISNKSLAESWAEQLISVAEKDPKNLVLVIADMARSEPPMEGSFIAELTRRLQEKGNSLALASSWLEQTLSDNGLSSTGIVQQENQKQAADQVSISNSISSLRFLSTTNWQDFVEQTSIVERKLREDPAGVYADMDFYTRDYYRHVVEKTAKYSDFSEEAIASIAIRLAENSKTEEEDIRKRHVGYYLEGEGLKRIQKEARMQITKMETCRGIVNAAPFAFYNFAFLIITGFASWGLIAKVETENLSLLSLVALSVIIVFAVSQFSITIIHWLVTVLARPAQLPRMDYSKGIPDENRSMVVIPTLLSSTSAIAELIENLEVHFLANRDANLCFALVTDFKDAKEKDMAEDDLLVQFARNKIIELNKKYDRSSNDTFFLFHRPRKYNSKDKVWMGYERKRGKLSDLNELILGNGKDNFSVIIGEERIYTTVKYIITLDSDTQLPRDTAWKMIATMAHPLNHPLLDKKKKRVTRGYTILQPRVSNSLSEEGSSIYSNIHGNEPGTDPYTKAISDVYQDLFHEGSFIGKGIYDVQAFEKMLNRRFPENRILSHDLLEGSYARAGLITDVQLYEEYPSSYLTDMQRRHRWVRGDWQIAHWLLPVVPGCDKRFNRNAISILSKWKITDNLRRSLVPLSLLVLFFYGWIISSHHVFWTFAVLGIIFLPVLINFIWQLCRKPSDAVFIQHLIYTSRSLKDSLARHIIDFICLPFEAFLNIDAIGRTIWRLYISGKHLLQWNPYSNAIQNESKIGAVYRKMWFAPFFAVTVFVLLLIYHPITSVLVFPFLAIWFASPFIVWYISKPADGIESDISIDQEVYLRKLARKTWSFFETFVTKEDNWLPPDNYQEQPVERIAHRTSPTNIGLSLLANLTAHDFGYITSGELLDLVDKTTGTMMRMEKYRGHLFNWYDTQTTQPLHPRYISTVDSGNLIGHLITLRQGIMTIPDKKIVTEKMFEGLLDEAGILLDKTDIPELKNFEEQLKQNYLSKLDSPMETRAYLESLENSLTEIFIQLDNDPETETEWWIQKLFTHIKNIRNELIDLVPWLRLPEVPGKFKDLIPSLAGIPTLLQLSKIEQSLLNKVNSRFSSENSAAENKWLEKFSTSIIESGRRAKEMILCAEQLIARCSQLTDVEYDFLYDKSQHLLTIGYNTEEHRKDNSYYDLLASEARLTTFIAIAQGKLPQQSWFALGRQLTHTGTTPVLLSWSGSMFEYLMPMLVMPTYKNTLLQQTMQAVIQKQIEYGKKRGVPWGVSESGYNRVDANLNYQYHAFGVPGLGFKRGLGEDLVISPYSSVMSLMVSPSDACSNLATLKEEGFEGRYGFYEAVDYTPSRLIRKQDKVIVRSFMVHHQGMSFLSLGYLLHNQPMQQRFESDVRIKSSLLLLQERIPRVTTFYSPTIHDSDTGITQGANDSMRVLTTPSTPIPEVQLLSNGRYHVMVTNAGGGYSRWKNISLTRWREDSTCDNYGSFCFIRDLDTGRYWSTAFQPTIKQSETYEAVFSQGRAEFRRRDMLLETHTEIVVSPEDDIELRRVHITNRSRKKRVLEITSYSEVVLNTHIADEMHPAFSNLFVQTEINEQRNAILCTRRPRSVDEQNPWMFHLMKVHNTGITNVSYETDRDLFIGRGNTIQEPKAINQTGPLSGSSGSVLDPIVSIQYRIVLEPYESAVIDMIYGIADTKDNCNILIEKYQDRHLINRALELAWTHSQVILRQINAAESDAQLYARLAGSIIFANPSLRADPSVIIKNQRGQSGLWSYSISGDIPIVLLQIEDVSNIDLVRQMLQAHAYWRLKGLLVDLVIWNEDHGGYRQTLQGQIQSLVSPGQEIKDQPGGIFIRSSDQISNEDRVLFQTVARVVISDKQGSLEEQVSGRSRLKTMIPYFSPSKFPASVETRIAIPNDLQFFNGYGGFSKDGTEYVINTSSFKATPAPWINVLANPVFGSIISESGQSYTWLENAHEFRLTPWNNDPVTDLRGEAIYLRDEESGRYWSPTPLPCYSQSPYITRHGFGYSVFEHSEDGVDTQLTIYTDIQLPVKYMVLRVHNRSKRYRRISATGYIEWVMGDLRSRSMMHVITEIDTRSGAILARNSYNTELGGRMAFFDADDANKSFTADRAEFIGRNGTLANPDAMLRTRLSNRTGASLDPCAAIQVVFDLEEGEDHEVVFRLGAGRNMEDTLNLIQKSEGNNIARLSLEKVKQYWKDTLQCIQVSTPDRAVDIMTNGWLNYQTIACRLWARSGFYQSGGAFGFRDQLQDVLSLLLSKPGFAKEQILLCASRQFKEGDVQHWWHPPAGRGVRTTCSDDYLWLPYVTAKYVSTTGDISILDETAKFLEGRLLNAGEESYYDLPITSDKSATLYEHCVRAIEHGLRFGANGLPLFGSGDWNDGMDKVGEHGKGESVWLAFFLYEVLNSFTEIAELKKDETFAVTCRHNAGQLRNNIQLHAWDGEWYRRGYFDDGTPLGSSVNDECKIDSIAQSWSVLSQGGDTERSKMAMSSADKHLVKKDDQIIQLFNPPFDKSKMYPGYIKGYVPGVRENGGQYTHAAVWLTMAFAAMGDREKTWELVKMINPVNHGNDNATINQYKTEPYVIAADVYAVKNHKGRGGWTWYTGSAGWMYQLLINSFIGLKLKGDVLSFKPCIPDEWKSLKVVYKFRDTVYNIELKKVETPDQQKDNVVALKNTGGTQDIVIYF